ncbi:hypothetical protein [Prescottella equi]|uniref:hypothetical protein n=1 Tax=Rhodococcus hoagii TaxID=43767 RepID=UPI001EEA2AD9|nr:hypothetical protein [Prescottella equi]
MTRGDIIDAIDFLVDDQLASYNDRSGYDHNVNQDRCWNCDGEWHGLAITDRMRRRRWFGQVDPGYRYADDDSRIYCPGSDVAGPVRDERGLPRWTITVGDQGTAPLLQVPRFESIDMEGCQAAMEQISQSAQRMADDLAAAFQRIGDSVRIIQNQTATLTPEDQRPHPIHPAIRRPSHTPPMWANNPSRTRRNRYGPTRRVK